MKKDQIDTAAKKAMEYTKVQAWPAWVKHLLTFLLGGAAAVATSYMTGCTRVTPQQVQGVHAAYHALSGKPCAFQSTRYEVRGTK